MFLLDMFNHKLKLPDAAHALPGRREPLPTATHHFVSGHSLHAPWPEGMEKAVFGIGCFWGAERKFWETPGVYVTAVGYMGGISPNPTYQEVCTGLTGHNEVVLVVHDPSVVSYDGLLKVFWENHDPTQGMRQGNDVGTQYRSGIYTFTPEQKAAARMSLATYGEALAQGGINRSITTEIADAGPFYYAEEYHQQYLAKNPDGYCGIGGTGVACPIGTGITAA
ncbi:MAG: peptide-methionine (S)-S-oxide reductase MsrA [Nitratireductor sp.]|nr:peptide-methionine (S)-S-oxide reductase MsrA [Nitratireductor sp.]